MNYLMKYKFFTILLLVLLGVFATIAIAETSDQLNVEKRIGSNAHWNSWAGDIGFMKYQDFGKSFGVVRDQAWWCGLEKSDLDNSGWSDAGWNYSYTIPSEDTPCGNIISYQSGSDNLVKLYQDDDSPKLLYLLNVKNNAISEIDKISYAQYYDYVYHVVERYDGDGTDESGNIDMPGLVKPVRFFEVGNEVDINRYSIFFSPNPCLTGEPCELRHGYLTPEDYVKYRLKPAYLAAKSANESTVIISSGLGMNTNLEGDPNQDFNTDYLEQMLIAIKNEGGAENNYYMDKVGMHYYADKYNPEKFDNDINKVKDILKKYGMEDKPIWITEFGSWHDSRLMTLMYANGIEMPISYSLVIDVTCKDGNEVSTVDSLNLLESITNANLLQDLTPFSPINEDLDYGTIYQRVFQSPEKKVTALWYVCTDNDNNLICDNPSDSTYKDKMMFSVLPQTFTVDNFGAVDFPYTPTNPINLKVGPEPIYFVESNLPIDVDLYFDKTTNSGSSVHRATDFKIGDTLNGYVRTTTDTEYSVRTYVTLTSPNGKLQYAYYDNIESIPDGNYLQFSPTKRPLYDGIWHTIANTWLWNIYDYTDGEMGVYRWNLWYEDTTTGEILGGDCAGYFYSGELNSAPLDLIFLIDTTGSMWDDIAAVKSSASEIVEALDLQTSDIRVAVADYRDYPQIPYGYPGLDYDYNLDLEFSNDEDSVISSINSLSLGNGWDWEESVFTALIKAMKDSNKDLNNEDNHGWRIGVNKAIILMGDAPPHNPEPWVGGYSLEDVAYWSENIDPVLVYSVVIGSSGATYNAFSEISERTGGKVYTSPTASDIVDTIIEVIGDIGNSPNLGVSVSINPAINEANLGQSVTYFIDVTNTGTIADTYDISIDPQNFVGTYRGYPTAIQESWIYLDRTSVEIEPDATEIVSLTISVPKNWAGMEYVIYPFEVIAKSETNELITNTSSAELKVIANKRSMVEYSRLETIWLSELIQSSSINDEIKISLLDKLTSATLKLDQTILNIESGKYKQANNMLSTSQNIINAFINQVEAQYDKKIMQPDAEMLMGEANTILQDIEFAKNI